MPTTTRRDDAALLQAWLAEGDEGALQALMRRHGSRLRSDARRALGPYAQPQLVDEVLGHATAALGLAGDLISRPAAVLGWLRQVVTNRARDLRRGLERQARWLDDRSPVEAHRLILDEAGTAGDLAEARPLLDEAIADLPDELRLVLEASLDTDRTQDRVAAELGVSERTVRNRHRRALDELRGWYRQRGFELGLGSLLLLLLGRRLSAGEVAAPRLFPGRIALATGAGAVVLLILAGMWWASAGGDSEPAGEGERLAGDSTPPASATSRPDTAPEPAASPRLAVAADAERAYLPFGDGFLAVIPGSQRGRTDNLVVEGGATGPVRAFLDADGELAAIPTPSTVAGGHRRLTPGSRYPGQVEFFPKSRSHGMQGQTLLARLGDPDRPDAIGLLYRQVGSWYWMPLPILPSHTFGRAPAVVSGRSLADTERAQWTDPEGTRPLREAFPGMTEALTHYAWAVIAIDSHRQPWGYATHPAYGQRLIVWHWDGSRVHAHVASDGIQVVGNLGPMIEGMMSVAFRHRDDGRIETWLWDGEAMRSYPGMLLNAGRDADGAWVASWYRGTAPGLDDRQAWHWLRADGSSSPMALDERLPPEHLGADLHFQGYLAPDGALLYRTGDDHEHRWWRLAPPPPTAFELGPRGRVVAPVKPETPAS